MSNTTFADRLKLAMERQGMKQVDLIRAASEQGVKLGKKPCKPVCQRKDRSAGKIFCGFWRRLLRWRKRGLAAGNLRKQKKRLRIRRKRKPALWKKESKDSENSGGKKMREFKKSTKLDDVLYDVRGPVVDEAERMEDAGMQVLKLNIGNPAPFGFRTPDEVIYDMRRQLTECEGYSPAKGLFSARKAIMQYAQLKHIPNVSMEDIYTGNGVSELINLCMSALLNDGDEILIPSPDYPLWTACATLAGGKAGSLCLR